MVVGVYILGYPPTVGGGFTLEQSYLRSLFRIPKQEGLQFKVISWNPQAKDGIPEHFSFVDLKACKDGFLFERLKQRIFGKKDFFAPKWVLEILKQEQIEFIIHLTPLPLTLEIPYAVPGWDYEHRTKPYFPEVSKNGEWDCREQMQTVIYRRASLILTGTEAGRDLLEFYFQIPKSRSKLARYPISHVDHNVDHSQKHLENLNLGGPFYLYPAQFWAHKNHMVLLRTLKILKEVYQRMPILVLTGSDKGNLSYIGKMATEMGVAEQVRFLGFVDRDTLTSLYLGAKALLFPSYCEPDNLPPIEAFGLGCPVIAGDHEGSREQFGDAAVLVDRSNPQEWAEAIIALETNVDQKNELIRQGKLVSALHTEECFAKTVESLLLEFSKIRMTWKD